jgi:hypothetical protein
VSTRWRKTIVGIVGLATIPAAIVAGFRLADRCYVLLFNGDIDFKSQDMRLEIFHGSIFAVAILILGFSAGWCVYRKLQ